LTIAQHPPIQPLRIKRLSVNDFRAFPGPEPYHFDLDGKNLLVYGENGAGKSSLFHALSDFFTIQPPSQSLPNHKNAFSGLGEDVCLVSVEFNDQKPAAEWTKEKGHPARVKFKSSDPRVTEGALRRSCIDYKALLNTNYVHGKKPINLFETAVEHLVKDFPVVVAGGESTTLRELWVRVKTRCPHNIQNPPLKR